MSRWIAARATASLPRQRRQSVGLSLSLMLPLVLTLALTSAQSAFAQPRGPRPGPVVRNPCGPDIQRLCADQPPGRGRVRACVEAHRDQLSKACLADLERREARAKRRYDALRASCEAEANAHCADVEARTSPLERCLARHLDQLGDSCRKALPTRDRRPRAPGRPGPRGADAAPGKPDPKPVPAVDPGGAREAADTAE